MQVIVYTNSNGGVSVCHPTGEIDIQSVLEKDCPPGAIIVDSSILPTGVNLQFFDAWELSGSVITVNLTKAKAIKLKEFNAYALDAAQKRQLNTFAGIDNNISDADFVNELKIGRDSIANAQTTDELVLIANPA